MISPNNVPEGIFIVAAHSGHSASFDISFLLSHLSPGTGTGYKTNTVKAVTVHLALEIYFARIPIKTLSIPSIPTGLQYNHSNLDLFIPGDIQVVADMVKVQCILNPYR